MSEAPRRPSALPVVGFLYSYSFLPGARNVEKLYSNPFKFLYMTGCSSVGRMLALGARGRRIVPCHPDKDK